MRPRPLSILLLLALSSFVIAQTSTPPPGLKQMGDNSVGGIGNSLTGLSCLQNPMQLVLVAFVLGSGGAIAWKKKSDGGSMWAFIGPVLSLMIIVRLLMNGGLCKSNIMGVLFVFSMIESLMTTDASSKNPLAGLLNIVLTMPLLELIVRNPAIMDNPTSLIMYLMIPSIITGGIDMSISGTSFNGFGGNVWKGLNALKKSIKGIPDGDKLEAEAEKELTQKLNQINKYIAKLEKEAEKRISAERKRARTEAKKQKKALHLEHDKYGKLEAKLFEDANELELLSADLSHDIDAIAEDVHDIQNAEETLKAMVKDTMHCTVSFIQQHHESAKDKLSKHGFGDSDLNAEMTSLEQVEQGCNESFNATLNGVVRFAKLSVLLETTNRIFETAEKYLKETEKFERKEETLEKEETKKEEHELDDKGLK